MTRLPRSQAGSNPDDLDGLEELGDDAIIAQQSAAHAPQPRAVVSEESRSVVISDHPQARRDTQPPRNSTAARAAAEPTLIIRDRRRLEDMRQQILERQAFNERNRRSRALYVWGGLGLAAFVLGGVVAFLATDSKPDAPAPAESAAVTRVEAQSPAVRPSPANAAQRAAPSPTPVRLDDLPVEPQKKK